MTTPTRNPDRVDMAFGEDLAELTSRQRLPTTRLEKMLGAIFLLDDDIVERSSKRERNLIKLQALLLSIPVGMGIAGMFSTLGWMTTSWFVLCLGALLWGGVVGLIDLAFVAMGYRSSSWLALFFRLLLAFVFSLVIASSIELWLFEDLIDNELARASYEEERALEASLKKQRALALREDPRVKEKEAEIELAAAALERARERMEEAQKTQRELDQRWMQERMRGGCGPICEQHQRTANHHRDKILPGEQNTLDAAEAALIEARAELADVLDSTDDQARAGAKDHQAAHARLTESLRDGVFARLGVLHELMERDRLLLGIGLLIKLLLVLVELSPLLIKSLMPTTLTEMVQAEMEQDRQRIANRARVIERRWEGLFDALDEKQYYASEARTNLDLMKQDLRARQHRAHLTSIIKNANLVFDEFAFGMDDDDLEQLKALTRERIREVYEMNLTTGSKEDADAFERELSGALAGAPWMGSGNLSG